MRFNTAQEAIQYELQILEAVGEIELERLRELADAERDGKIRIGSDWTPCDKGLPEDGQEVLFDIPCDMMLDDLYGTYKGQYKDGTFWIDEYDHKSTIGAPKETVTKWMPCPKPEHYNPNHIVDTNKKADQFREPTKMMQNDM